MQAPPPGFQPTAQVLAVNGPGTCDPSRQLISSAENDLRPTRPHARPPPASSDNFLGATPGRCSIRARRTDDLGGGSSPVRYPFGPYRPFGPHSCAPPAHRRSTRPPGRRCLALPPRRPPRSFAPSAPPRPTPAGRPGPRSAPAAPWPTRRAAAFTAVNRSSSSSNAPPTKAAAAPSPRRPKTPPSTAPWIVSSPPAPAKAPPATVSGARPAWAPVKGRVRGTDRRR